MISQGPLTLLIQKVPVAWDILILVIFTDFPSQAPPTSISSSRISCSPLPWQQSGTHGFDLFHCILNTRLIDTSSLLPLAPLPPRALYGSLLGWHLYLLFKLTERKLLEGRLWVTCFSSPPARPAESGHSRVQNKCSERNRN